MPTTCDNCPDAANADQADYDNDGELGAHVVRSHQERAGCTLIVDVVNQLVMRSVRAHTHDKSTS